MSALLVRAVVQDGQVRLIDETFYRARAKRAARAWGDGCALTIRIEPEEDAVQHHQYKHLFGHLFTPVSDYTGYTTAELKLNLVRPMSDRTGPVRAEGKVIHAGRQIATSEGRLVGADGKLYAHGTTTCVIFGI